MFIMDKVSLLFTNGKLKVFGTIIFIAVILTMLHTRFEYNEAKVKYIELKYCPMILNNDKSIAILQTDIKYIKEGIDRINDILSKRKR